MFTITIKTDNAAFEGGVGEEIARILKRVAKGLEEESAFLCFSETMPLYDTNGNQVGHIRYVE